MTRFLAVLSGLLLAVATAIVLPWAGAAVLALVVAGWWWRVAAVAAALAALGVLLWPGASTLVCAATGLVVTAYLLGAAAVRAPAGVVPTSLPSVAGALLFAAAAVAAAAVPVRLAWAPLAAPVLVIVLYAWIVRGLATTPGGADGDS
ncbi:hypothetical protein [Nocardia sp. alder85J]|uniref:hypothetical protein n=1 Tax=Nocardia sp. alder85J TaxID=2862949 RepID=UPI001CD388BC|nr:hypothetical protein [Nocardia sp. alder85J]MCX4093496.1 hypothetical protein [Nocardia sp. alder85J]